MAKYEVTHTGGPLYRQARETPGVHVHADASETDKIGVVLERITDDGQTVAIKNAASKIRTPRVQVAEARAALYGVRLAMTHRTEGEHLFLYTDAKEVVYALYGKGSPVQDDLTDPITQIVDHLPDPTDYSIILCDRQVNPAHDVARGRRED